MSKMTYSQFNGVIANDNTNVENIIRKYINESANASVVSFYDDALILVDTLSEGHEFYRCNYYYNPDTLSVILEDFEQIELEDDSKVSFKTAVKDYLMSEEEDASELLNSYLKTLNKSKIAVQGLVAEAVADKDFSKAADFEELSFINAGFDALRESEFFEAYEQRLITHPLNDVLFLDWQTPVAFTLQDTCETKNYINSCGKKKAKKLCASKDFKKKVCAICKDFKEDVEEGGDELLELFSENMSLFSLTDVELKEMVAKAAMLDPETSSEYKKLAEAVVHYVNEDDAFTYLRESIDIDDEGDEEKKSEEPKTDDKPADDGDEEKKADEEHPEDDKAVELSDEDKEKLIDALKTVVEKSTDEKIQKMAKDLLDKFEDEDGEAKEGTKPEDVKEAVRFLSI